MASISLRPYETKDRGFVIMSFVRSYGRSAYATGVPAAVLIDLLDPLLIAWDTTVAEAPDGELLGWICSRPGRLAWLFVKPEFRRRGVARALLERAEVGRTLDAPFVPTKAPDGSSFASWSRARGYTVHYRPYLPLVEVHGVAGGTE
jgi:GNAT superfamily N-acetyltransferase